MMDDAPDVDDVDDPVDYAQVMTAHMLHRIWELQIASLFLQADSDEDRQFIQSVIDKQQTGDYTQPFRW